MTRDPRRLTEIRLHMHIAGLLRHKAAPGVMWWHPANGEKRDKATAHKLAQMGVKPGVSDLNFILPRQDGHCAAFLELKGDGGRLSPEQRDFLESAAAIGCLTGVAYSPEQALAILLEWGAVRAIGG